MKKVALAALFLAIGSIVGMISLRNHISKSGGSYKYSPDGRWLAEISDGYSKSNNRKYAVIELWDVNKYPSMKNHIRLPLWKVRTAGFEFPQNIDARSSECNVVWTDDSSKFYINFVAESPTNTKHRQFEYDLKTDQFELNDSNNP
jgi:hypothetical protein